MAVSAMGQLASDADGRAVAEWVDWSRLIGFGRTTASLSRTVSSFALATSCVTRLCSFTLRLTMPHGALASLRGRPEPPHDGIRRMGRYNLSGALAAGQRQDRRTLRTHPTRRPREDIFPPEQNALSPRLQFHGVLRRRFRQP